MTTASTSQDLQTRKQSQSNNKRDAAEEELLYNGIWAAAITTISYAYGDMTVASVLPRDARQNAWLLMLSPIPTFVFSLLYVAFVAWIGPNYMRNREPVKGLKTLMMLYNAFQVVLSGYIFFETGMAGWFGSYAMICEPCDYTTSPRAMRMLNAAYWYYFSKFVDFIDTFFFVIHKKYSHISLLHLCHHAIMPISMWYGVRFHPGGHNTYAGFLNALVHTVMYTYYLLAAMGPIARPFLWWKKYLTTMQIVQFLLIIGHSMVALVVECSVPPAITRWLGCMAVVFLVLFTDFYIKAYRKGEKKKQLSAHPEKHSNGDLSNGNMNGIRKVIQNGMMQCTPSLNGDLTSMDSVEEKMTFEPEYVEQSVRSRVTEAS